MILTQKARIKRTTCTERMAKTMMSVMSILRSDLK